MSHLNVYMENKQFSYERLIKYIGEYYEIYIRCNMYAGAQGST